MYKNINNYYFSRPDYGYAYANPYRMNFSRSYPRVVIYNGQQNFNKFTDFVKKHGRKAALAGALLAAGIPAAHQAGKSVGENTKVPQTYMIAQPIDSGENPEDFYFPSFYSSKYKKRILPGEYVVYDMEKSVPHKKNGDIRVHRGYTFLKPKGKNKVFILGDHRDKEWKHNIMEEWEENAQIDKGLANYWPDADLSSGIHWIRRNEDPYANNPD